MLHLYKTVTYYIKNKSTNNKSTNNKSTNNKSTNNMLRDVIRKVEIGICNCITPGIVENLNICICICSSKLHLSLRSILAAGALSSYMKARLELDHVISDLICTD